MRIVSVRENEGLVIDDDICVTVLQIRDDSVHVAVSCPRLTPSYWEQTLFLNPQADPGELQLSAARN
jgi:hypothetical protein